MLARCSSIDRFGVSLDPESVALVRPAQPVVIDAVFSMSANGEPFAINVESEQHRPGPSLHSAHESQHPRPSALTSIANALG